MGGGTGTGGAAQHYDLGMLCCVAHSDHGQCIRCACGEWHTPAEWDKICADAVFDSIWEDRRDAERNWF